MAVRDWIIVVGVICALPVWCYSAYHHLRNRPGARSRMLKSGGIFIAIIGVTMIAAMIATLFVG